LIRSRETPGSGTSIDDPPAERAAKAVEALMDMKEELFNE
jgi:hypothetical protein